MSETGAPNALLATGRGGILHAADPHHRTGGRGRAWWGRAATGIAVVVALVVAVGPVTGAAAASTPTGSGPAAPAAGAGAPDATATDTHVVVVTHDATGRPVIQKLATASTTDARRLSAALTTGGTVAVPDREVHATSFGDPLRDDQWALDTVGYEHAWTSHDATGQVVAVIDTGVNPAQEDLAAGQVLTGTDFVDYPDHGGDGHDDVFGHGTAVASVIAATPGNLKGISGAARGAKILPVRVLGADGTGDLSDVASALIWAADHGATVANLSLAAEGLSSFLPVDDAIRYARSKGVVVVAAAGNDGVGGPLMYPADNPDVIAVAATTSTNTVASFSSRGSWVSLAAPGQSIVLPEITFGTGAYAWWNGTSFASPYAASEAALIRATAPSLTPDQVKAVMTSTADPMPGTTVTDVGAGLVDPVGALSTARSMVAPPAPYAYLKVVTPDRAVVANPNGGYYVMAGNGVVRSYGGAPLFGSPNWGAFQIARSMAVMPDGQGT